MNLLIKQQRPDWDNQLLLALAVIHSMEPHLLMSWKDLLLILKLKEL